MKSKKYSTLIVGGSVALVLLILVGLLLYRKVIDYRQTMQQVNARNAELKQLTGRDPFPSAENREILVENLEVIQVQLNQMLSMVRQERLEAAPMERADFTQFLESIQRDLIRRASRAGTRLPDSPSFGFARYVVAGQSPERDHIPRLVRQMRMVEMLCRELFDARILSLDEITRQTFDEDSDRDLSLARGRDRTQMAPGEEPDALLKEQRDDLGVYSWEEFTLEFTAREPVLWDVIERFASAQIPIRIASLNIQTVGMETQPRRGVGPAAREGTRAVAPRGVQRPVRDIREVGAEGADLFRGDFMDEAIREDRDAEPPPREDRLVKGSELLKIEMQVRVYRFLDDEDTGEITW